MSGPGNAAKSLLARKGAAVPVGGRTEGDEYPDREPETLAPTPEVAQLTLISVRDEDAPAAEGGEEPEPPPAASLLPFTLRDGSGASAQVMAGWDPDAGASLAPGRGIGTDAAARPTEPRLAPSRQPWSKGWLWFGEAMAVVGVIAIGWMAFSFDAPGPKPSADQPPAASTAPDTTPPEKTARTQAATEPTEQAPSPTEPSPAEPGAPASAPATASATTAPAPAPVDPSVDVVRIDPDGSAVIAGRAAPRSEIIVLDNGKPVGTAVADAFGEWVFVPNVPLPEGGHEFGLVVKAVKGKVVMPARNPAHEQDPVATQPSESPAATRPSGATGSGAVPRPVPKPEAMGAPAGGVGDFVVQLASVKTRSGARLEWSKLKRRFPDALAGMKLRLAEAKLADRGTVIRVRTGGFTKQHEAVRFCARFRAARQECLVVRTAGGS